MHGLASIERSEYLCAGKPSLNTTFMRKLLNYLLLITASVVFMSGSCSGGDDPEPEPGPTPVEPKQEVKLSPTALTFAAENAPEQTVTVTTASGIWTAKSDQEWCFATRRDNTTLIVGVNYNYGTTARTATVTVTSGDKTATLSVTQAGSVPTLTVSRNAMRFNAGGGQDSIVYVHCSPTYEGVKYEVSEGADWLHVSPDDGTFSSYMYVSADYNHSFSPRKATITVTLPEAEPQVIQVTQAAGFIAVENPDQEVSFPYFSSAYMDYYSYFSVITTAEDPENIRIRIGDESWLYLEKEDSHGFGEDEWVHRSHWDEQDKVRYDVAFHSFYVGFKENSSFRQRNNTIEFLYHDSVLITIPAVQLPSPRLSVVAPHGTALPTSGGSLDVRVYANYEWTVTEPKVSGNATGEVWFTMQRVSDSMLRFTCQPNTTGKQRPRCYVTVKAYGGEENIYITEQDGTAGEGYGYGDGTQWDGQ